MPAGVGGGYEASFSLRSPFTMVSPSIVLLLGEGVEVGGLWTSFTRPFRWVLQGDSGVGNASSGPTATGAASTDASSKRRVLTGLVPPIFSPLTFPFVTSSPFRLRQIVRVRLYNKFEVFRIFLSPPKSESLAHAVSLSSCSRLRKGMGLSGWRLQVFQPGGPAEQGPCCRNPNRFGVRGRPPGKRGKKM